MKTDVNVLFAAEATRNMKLKTVLCHGVFDVLHYGHLKHLQKAKSYGHRLVVSVTSDRFVNKGPGRPYFTAERRSSLLAAMGIVDETYICDSATAIEAIRKFKPDFYVKGQDYREASDDVTGEILNERKEVESYGGQVVYTNEETFSSGKVINGALQDWSSDQRDAIARVQASGGIKEIERAINNIAGVKTLVVGEPIKDIYRFVNPEGISSKAPCVSARFVNQEIYFGGAVAIGNHLKSFCEVSLCTGKQATKIRYISGTQRVFEVTEIDDTYRPVDIASGYDVYVVADFGHGMFRGGELEEIKGFVGLNVQTNSSNFGFNVFQKHKRFNYLCLDTRETRLATHDRISHPITVAHTVKEMVQRPFGFTAGPNGAYLLDGAQTYYSPTFSDVIVDATGAGDAYFAITTLLLATGCDNSLVPFIGNVFAGLKCKIIGNKAPVTKAQLLKACAGILK